MALMGRNVPKPFYVEDLPEEPAAPWWSRWSSVLFILAFIALYLILR